MGQLLKYDVVALSERALLATGDSTNAERRARTCKKLIRFTSDELAIVKDRAAAAGRPVACFIRDMAVGNRKRVPSHVGVGAVVIRDLSRVATHLCALRDVARECGLPAAKDFGTAVDDLLDLIRRID